MKYLAMAAVIAGLGGATPAFAQSEEWTPLTKDFFGELTAPWIPVPNGDSGAPRQGWLATADGFFTREAHLAYSYTDATAETHEVLARFNYPLSRRFWIGTELPFYRDVGGESDVGDATITTQVMLLENRNLSVNAGVGWRIPVGSATSVAVSSRPNPSSISGPTSGAVSRSAAAYRTHFRIRALMRASRSTSRSARPLPIMTRRRSAI
ncbi:MULTISPECIES: hypothetical protein [unclassified Sphingomonas]|jgi:hypothetical protein|uniref:hypothetical protein n=1 Tax=unclassified Sphingomonas TaxID=196159 RepID=UPI0008337412|nr:MULTISPECIES: hypothetical protein [unclassified Sphingomonas]